MNPETRSTVLAATVIFVFAVGGWFVLPPLMQWLGAISPWLALVAAAVFVGAFFAIFWLRARYQRSKGR